MTANAFKSKWIGALVVGGAALLGINASAAQRVVTAAFQVANGTCSASGAFYATRGSLWTNFPSEICATESTGSTSTGNCGSQSPHTLQVDVGTVSTSTWAFTPGPSGCRNSKTYAAGANVSVTCSPVAGCTIQGIASTFN